MSLIRIPRAEAVVALSFVSLLFALPLQAQTDDPALINITNLEQLDAMRYDLDGDGLPTSAGQTDYDAAFGVTSTVDGDATTPNASATSTGYELRESLDFEVDASYATSSRNLAWIDPTNGGTTDTPGWEPIGGFTFQFKAVFEGNDFKISNLYIDHPNNSYMGFFGVLGSGGEVRHLGIEGGSVTGGGNVGGLVGGNVGTISACYTTGNATITRTGLVGGLVGENDGTIRASYATGNTEATAGGYAGGLVGHNRSGSISACYATGTATATGDNGRTGGLAGYNLGSISACYATGNAEATGSGDAGGLVGYNRSGSISACYATGDATTVNGNAGGLAGYNEDTISASFCTGDATATGSGSVGGLVGENDTDGTITTSYFDSDLSTATDGVGAGTIITGLGKTTAELQGPLAYGTGIYTAWNVDVDDADDDETLDTGVDDPWDFGTSSQYPALKVDFDGDTDATAYEFGGQERSAPTLAVAPAAPTGFSAGSPTTNSVDLSWTAPVDTHTGFIVKYSTTMGFDPASEGTEFTSAIAADATGVTVTGLSSGTTYYFRVAAVNGVTIGIYAAEVSATTIAPPPPPPNNGDISLIDITTLEQLDAMRYDLDGDGVASIGDEAAYLAAFGAPSCTDGCTGYELMESLDFEDADGDGTADDKSIWAEGSTVAGAVAEGWPPIGGAFKAVFEGNNHTISNLYIDLAGTRAGLFNTLHGGSEVRRLGIEGGSVKATGSNSIVGGLVVLNKGTIRACYATGNVTTGGANTVAGVLVGQSSSSGTIMACYATGNVSGSNVGGLMGINYGTISGCYATGNASGVGNIGGLVGQNDGGSISACYATGNASGVGNIGGLVGGNRNGATIRACYATGDATTAGGYVGGLVGLNNGDLTYSYFDYNVSNRPASDANSKTTAELQEALAYGGIYADWNIDVDDADTDDDLATGVDDPWDFGTSSQYPALKVDFDGNSSATWEEFGDQRGSAPTLAVAPAKLLGLTPGAVTNESVELSWTAPIDTHTGFIVKYSTTMGYDPASEGTEFTSAIAADATGVTVTGLSSGTTYYFRVAAVNGVTIGIYAAEVSATPAATLSVSPDPLSFVAGGETLPLSITSNTSWTTASDAGWLTLSGASGSGNMDIDVVATANPTTSARTAVITITYGTSSTEETVDVTQAAGDATLSVDLTLLMFVSGGETLPLSIMSNTDWTAESDAGWLTLSPSSGTGTGSESINVEATANTTTSVRTATITITYGASMTEIVSVSQAAGAATLTVSPASLTFGSVGETLPLSITSNTSWTATKDADWLTLSPLSGTGTGSESINVEATANTTGSERTATITITDGGSLTEMVTVSQDDPSATLTVLPTSLTFVAEGETQALTITSNTSWTTASDVNWLTLSALSGTGTGSESINVEASENTMTSERTATITIAYGTSSTRMVSVSQAAMPMISFGSPSGAATDDATSTSAPLEVSLEVSNGGFAAATNITITVAATTGTIADGDYTLAVKSGSVATLTSANPYTLSVPANETSITLEFTSEDADNEGEVATLTLSSSTATNIGTEDVHTITITDNDVPTMTVTPMISFVSASDTATDDATSTSASLEVSLEVSNGGFVSDTNITITVAATTGTIADGDYTLAVKSGSVATLTSANPYTLSVPANETSITLEFTSEDADNEGEVATLTLSSSTATNIGTEDVHTITITDNDEPAGASTDVFNVPSEDGVLRVYPHPASDVVSLRGLSSTRRYAYSLYSLTGVEVLSGLLEADTIDVSTLVEGQYVLVLRSEKEELLRSRLLILK